MIDGITIKYTLDDFETWKKNLKVTFSTNIDIESGAVKSITRNDKTIITYRAKWETFDLCIKQVCFHKDDTEKYYLRIRGSLHKNHFGGQNHQPFDWQRLQDQINHLCTSLSIDPLQAKIARLEVGLNVNIPPPVSPFLHRNIIAYKRQLFNRYKEDAAGFCLGIVCNMSQYAVKIYDKGLQYGLETNLMRFELRYLKMQILNKKGIRLLSDLQNVNIVYELGSLLFQAWRGLMIYDLTVPINSLTINNQAKELLISGQNPKYWDRMNDAVKADRVKYVRQKFKALVKKYGKNNQSIILKLIEEEWRKLFLQSQNLPVFTIKIKGKERKKSIVTGHPISHFLSLPLT